MNKLLIVTALLVALPLAVITRGASRFSLTEADISAALAWGQTGEPAPHLVPCLAPKPVPACTAAAVYTPFVRVALASRAARRSSHAYGRGHVTPDLLEERFYAALRYDLPLEQMPFGDRVKNALLRLVLLPNGLGRSAKNSRTGFRRCGWSRPRRAWKRSAAPRRSRTRRWWPRLRSTPCKRATRSGSTGPRTWPGAAKSRR